MALLKEEASNLCESVQHISKHLHSKNQNDLIFTDFTKAVNRVHNDVMLSKLNKFGVFGL